VLHLVQTPYLKLENTSRWTSWNTFRACVVSCAI